MDCFRSPELVLCVVAALRAFILNRGRLEFPALPIEGWDIAIVIANGGENVRPQFAACFLVIGYRRQFSIFDRASSRAGYQLALGWPCARTP